MHDAYKAAAKKVAMAEELLEVATELLANLSLIIKQYGSDEAADFIRQFVAGQAEFGTTTTRRRGIAGQHVDVTLFAAGGAPTSSPGVYLRYDHLPGGWLMVPRGQLPPVSAEFVLDGKLLRVER